MDLFSHQKDAHSLLTFLVYISLIACLLSCLLPSCNIEHRGQTSFQIKRLQSPAAVAASLSGFKQSDVTDVKLEVKASLKLDLQSCDLIARRLCLPGRCVLGAP